MNFCIRKWSVTHMHLRLTQKLYNLFMLHLLKIEFSMSLSHDVEALPAGLSDQFHAYDFIS